VKQKYFSFQDKPRYDQAVSELVDYGCVHEVPFIRYVVNPLSVATSKSVKKRLILDLSVLNKF
jgi:hypothetical protein